MLPVMDRGIWVNIKSSLGYEANRIDEQGGSYSASSPGLRFRIQNSYAASHRTSKGGFSRRGRMLRAPGNAAAFAIKSLSNRVVMTHLAQGIRRSFSTTVAPNRSLLVNLRQTNAGTLSCSRTRSNNSRGSLFIGQHI